MALRTAEEIPRPLLRSTGHTRTNIFTDVCMFAGDISFCLHFLVIAYRLLHLSSDWPSDFFRRRGKLRMTRKVHKL